MDLFYFISSLPMPKFGEKPVISHSQFIDECAAKLPQPQADAIASISLDVDGEAVKPMFKVQKDWRDFETSLRNTAARIRAARLHRTNATQSQTDFSSLFLQNAVENAFNIPSPAEREKVIDELRWQFLDSLETQHLFDADALAIYALKLLLLERIQSRQLTTGIQGFQTLVKNGIDQAESIRVNS